MEIKQGEIIYHPDYGFGIMKDLPTFKGMQVTGVRQQCVLADEYFIALPQRFIDTFSGTYWEAMLNKTRELKNKPKIVCLCGSTRFLDWFMIKAWELEKQGIISLGVNILPPKYFKEDGGKGAEQEGVAKILDELHLRKIDLADEVFVLNVDGYIGESTRNEINYAIAKGKKIEYLESI